MNAGAGDRTQMAFRGRGILSANQQGEQTPNKGRQVSPSIAGHRNGSPETIHETTHGVVGSISARLVDRTIVMGVRLRGDSAWRVLTTESRGDAAKPPTPPSSRPIAGPEGTPKGAA